MKYELLRSVAQDIVNGSLDFDMSEWCETHNPYTVGDNGESVLKNAEQTACGTTACIAGWLAIRGGTAALWQNSWGRWDYRVDPQVADEADDQCYDWWSYAGMKALEIDVDTESGFFDAVLFHLPNDAARRVLGVVAVTEHMTVSQLRDVVEQAEREHYASGD